MTTLLSEPTELGFRRCDARCYDAKGPDCRCCCGGRFHGQGFARALDLRAELERETGRRLGAVQLPLEFGED